MQIFYCCAKQGEADPKVHYKVECPDQSNGIRGGYSSNKKKQLGVAFSSSNKKNNWGGIQQFN